MPTSQTRLTSGSTPLRQVSQRASFLLFLSASIGLLIFGKFDPGLTQRTQARLADLAAPILSLLSEQVGWARSGGEWVANLFWVHGENARLSEQNERLLQWRDTALRLQQENTRLRDLLTATETRESPVLTSRVIGEPAGPFLRAVLIDAGSRDGVDEYQPVMDAHGLVGRIVTAGATSSRVLLLNDLNSRVPVTVGEGDHRAVLEGDNKTFPKLTFLPFDAVVSKGDRVRTSGDGGVFPPDLPIGEVVELTASGAKVRLFSDLSRLNFVRVIAFAPPKSPEEGGMLDEPPQGLDVTGALDAAPVEATP